MTGKVDTPVLGSEEMEVASGHNQELLTASQGFLLFLLKTFPNHADRGDLLYQGDAKVVGSSEEIPLLLTWLLSPHF